MGFHTHAVNYWPTRDQFDTTSPIKYGSLDIDFCIKQPLTVEVGSLESSDWSFSPPGSATLNVPSLEHDGLLDDDSRSNYQSRPSKKQRSVSTPTFVLCSEEHPLYDSHDNDTLDNTEDAKSTKDIKMSLKLNALFDQRMMKLRNMKNESSPISPWGAEHGTLRDREEQFPSEFDVVAGQDRELTVFDVRARLHFGVPRKRNRLNSNFLRQFVAERQMLQNGKINFIPTRAILPPRSDHIMAEPADVVLGISAGWQKTRRSRDWKQLNAESFAVH